LETSLTELNSDLRRFPGSGQREQIQRQFFLHANPQEGGGHYSSPPADTSRRKTWNIPGNNESGGVQSLRNHWSAPRSIYDHVRESPPRDYDGASRSSSSAPYGARTMNGGGDVDNSNYKNNTFRLHSNADYQGNRLFSRPG